METIQGQYYQQENLMKFLNKWEHFSWQHLFNMDTERFGRCELSDFLKKKKLV